MIFGGKIMVVNYTGRNHGVCSNQSMTPVRPLVMLIQSDQTGRESTKKHQSQCQDQSPSRPNHLRKRQGKEKRYDMPLESRNPSPHGVVRKESGNQDRRQKNEEEEKKFRGKSFGFSTQVQRNQNDRNDQRKGKEYYQVLKISIYHPHRKKSYGELVWLNRKIKQGSQDRGSGKQ